MPPYPGEERLVTVFSDIHYYFAQPTARPVLHRFDKASYFYIYYNSTRHSSRIEIANNPGTPDQDAVNGYIERCSIVNSYKFPTLVTLVVDGSNNPSSPTSPVSGRDPDEWRLTSGDPRDTGRAKYKVHTMDIYFWAQEDSKLVLECFKKLLHPSQLDVVELEPQQKSQPTTASNTLSPVVQNLENMAIADQRQSTISPNSVPPPPGVHQAHSPSPVISDTSNMDRRTSTRSEKPAFVPMAYNPAAPAAPEPIAHREKTPPPVDATGPGLQHAAMHDDYHPTQSYNHYGSPPPQSTASPPSFGPQSVASPPSFGPQSGTSFGPQSTAPSFGPQSTASPGTAPSFGPGAVATGHRHSTAAETYVPHTQSGAPAITPGSQFYNSVQPPAKPLQHVQPQYPDYLSAGQAANQGPVGGFAQFNYGHHGSMDQRDPANPVNPYDVHAQVYRPTEEEYAAKHRKPSRKPSESKSPQSKFDQGADRIEKGVGKLFKKIEKKIG